jgi:hypothetical protein
MIAVRAGNWDEAAAQGRRAGAVGRDVVDWHRLRAGRGDFDEAVDFLGRNATGPASTSCGGKARAACRSAAGRRRCSPSSATRRRRPGPGPSRSPRRSRRWAAGPRPRRRSFSPGGRRTLTTGDEALLLSAHGALLRAASRGAARHAPLEGRGARGRADAAAGLRRLAEGSPVPAWRCAPRRRASTR